MRIKTKEDYNKVQKRRRSNKPTLSLPLGKSHQTKSGKKKENAN